LNCTDQWVEDDFVRGVTYYVLEKNGVAAGCVAFEKADETQCYMERLAVLPAYRRSGCGKALARHVMSVASGLGLKRVGIGVIGEDVSLKHWYRKFGFVSQ